jgi:MFS family permease
MSSSTSNWSRTGRLTGGLVVAVLFMGSTLLTPLYDLYRTAYGFSSLVLVLLYAVYVIGNLLALLVFGRLSDQIGRKPLVIASLALGAVSAAAFLVARSLDWLFAARIVSGLAVGIGSGAATAWITEFTRPERRARAAILMTGFNFIGLALGPILAGALVEYAPQPFRVPFGAYLVILAITALIVVGQPETLAARSKVRLTPKLGIPPGARAAFIAPAAAGFTAMAVVGFYAALGPTAIRLDLHVTNRALASAMVAGLFVLGAVLIFATPRVSPRAAMLAGLGATPIGMALLVCAQQFASIPAFLLGTGACSVAGSLGYRGGLSVANSLAPPERRAEIASAFFICCFCGNALPIIGLGALTEQTSRHFADTVFAGVVSGVALIAWIASFAVRVSPGDESE